MTKTLIKGGRVINPATETDDVCDVLIADGRIEAIGPDISLAHVDEVISLTPDHWVTPGLVDLHVHFREPGRPDKETMASGAEAAIAGGFTTVCMMPNTDPPLDDLPTLEYVNQVARKTPVRILPVPAATKELKGEEITEMKSLHANGAVAFSDDGRCIMNANVMRLALAYSGMLGVPIMQHAEDHHLSGKGCMNEGSCATRLGLPGSPNTAESAIVARDIELVRQTGGRLHVCHLSTREAVALIRQAKIEGLPVTAEVTPHHIALTDAAVQGYDPDFKMCPPLRSEADRQALIEGLLDGTIDAIASDHAPHTPDEKALAFDQAPNGVIGLETTVGVVLTQLFHTGFLSPLQIVRLMTSNPAHIINHCTDRHIGQLIPGYPADITVIDANRFWLVDSFRLKSRSKNTCFKGSTLQGKAIMTFIEGSCVFNALHPETSDSAVVSVVDDRCPSLQPEVPMPA